MSPSSRAPSLPPSLPGLTKCSTTSPPGPWCPPTARQQRPPRWWRAGRRGRPLGPQRCCTWPGLVGLGGGRVGDGWQGSAGRRGGPRHGGARGVAHGASGPAPWTSSPPPTKVAKLHDALAVDEGVGGLEVAVDDALRPGWEGGDATGCNGTGVMGNSTGQSVAGTQALDHPRPQVTSPASRRRAHPPARGCAPAPPGFGAGWTSAARHPAHRCQAHRAACAGWGRAQGGHRGRGVGWG